MAVTTTLPLFWHLSSNAKDERLDASVKLISVLEDFQARFRANEHSAPKPVSGANAQAESGGSESDEGVDAPDAEGTSKELDTENAADVAYALRRLMRGLASPRESSRLGFAVALTELMKRVGTITCDQMLTLLNTTSQVSDSMSKQEERDVLFARLFGIKSIIQSGLVVSQNPLKSSSTTASSLKSFENICSELLSLGEKKSWLRESCWWTLCSAIDALHNSSAPWKTQGFKKLIGLVYGDGNAWSADKVAVTIKLQRLNVEAAWKTLCGPYFKDPALLSKANLLNLGRILKDSDVDDEDSQSSSKTVSTPWKSQLHFVWDIILDTVLSAESSQRGHFGDLYRAVVDESLFASSSSPERKYWGFLIFQKCLHRLPSYELPMLFTKNFMRTWINHLSKTDRYLHKISRQIALDVKDVVEKNPQIGFSVVLQLTGVNGSTHFDNITRTKTVESVLASMNKDGVDSYIHHLLDRVNVNSASDSHTSVDARRAWIIDQVAIIIKRSSVPKSNEVVELALDWLTIHAFFEIRKKPSKMYSGIIVPKPPFSDALKKACTSKLFSCLSDGIARPYDADNPSGTREGPAHLSHVLETIKRLREDKKHFSIVQLLNEDQYEAFSEALAASESSKAVDDAASGVKLLLQGLALLCYAEGTGEDWEALQDCIETAHKLRSLTKEVRKKKGKIAEESPDEERPPIDLIIDIIIGLLERSTALSRMLANQCISRLSSSMTGSTVDLLLAQLERRDLEKEASDGEEEDMRAEEESSSLRSEDSQEEEEEESAMDEDEAIALREALDAVISRDKSNGGADDAESSSESSMDDDQMMAIDERLTEVFRTEAERRGKGKDVDAQREATHFKNRVLDLVDVYMRKQPTNPLVFRFIIPLLDLALASSLDEKQLSDKTKGILRSRLQKARDVPALTDASDASELLKTLHDRARKASSSEGANLISLCSIFVSKSLIACDEKAVIETYAESAKDFVTRKTSALTPAFFFDFIRRYPSEALETQSTIIGSLDEATNGYRLSQAFSILQTIYTSLQQQDSKEVLSRMQDVSNALETVISKSCSNGKMTAPQMKEILKAAQQLCRLSKRYASDTETSVDTIWVPAKWESLASNLSSSNHYASSPSLSNICTSIAKAAQTQGPAPDTKGIPDDKAPKRKADGDAETKRSQRKKAKKASGSEKA